MKKKKHQHLLYVTSDEELINFFEVATGNIAENTLYRSSSPLKGGAEDKKTIVIEAKEVGINCIINLDDDNSAIEQLSKDVPWYHNLVLEGKVICLPMTFNIPGDTSNEKKLKAALQFIISHNGPYLIHCYMGVDRTGFVVALLEILMESTLNEICNDYLIAFPFDYSNSKNLDNYIKIDNLFNQFKKMFRSEDILKINIQSATENYLLNNIGLSTNDISKLKKILSGKK